MRINTLTTILALTATLSWVACGDEEGTIGGGGGGGTVLCDQATDDEGRVVVCGEITEDTTWEAGSNVLLGSLVFVTSGTLTIGEGVTVQGEAGSALIITTTGSIEARGTPSQPIVFTSSKAEADRARGDWGGIVLLGNAPINVDSGQIEGIDASDARGSYGGSDSAHDCGTLRYVRIEYAGFTIGADNELNGLTLGGCGSDTDLEWIQSHMGDDDGIEFFGGTASMRHVVISYAADDSLDWDEGWQGNVQFLVIKQEGAEGDNGFESDNLDDNNDATPRSNPTIYNATMLGSNDPDASQRAMNLRRGTAGTLRNFIIQGFPKESIDIRDDATVGNIENGDLSIDNTLIYEIGEGGDSYFSDEPTDGSDDDDDGGFVEEDWLNDDAGDDLLIVGFGVDPLIADPYSRTPDPVPAANSPAGDGEWYTGSPGGWFDEANYVGAFEPGGTNWMDGWTNFE